VYESPLQAVCGELLICVDISNSPHTGCGAGPRRGIYGALAERLTAADDALNAVHLPIGNPEHDLEFLRAGQGLTIRR